MEIQKEREVFEKFCFDQFLMSPSDGCFELEDDGFYESLETHRLWVLWQLKAQTIPDGFVLVPKEPTEEMMFAGYESKENTDNLRINYKAMIAAQEQSHD